MAKLPTVEAARQTLIQAAREFYAKQWMVGTSGNLSIRTHSAEGRLQYVITASGVDKGALTPEDCLLLTQGGLLLEDTSHKSSAETLLHEALYRLMPDAGAVYHVHTVAATVLSRQLSHAPGYLEFSDLEMLKGLGQHTHATTVALPVIANTQDIAGLSTQVSQWVNPVVPGLVLQGHGLYVWGQTPADARRHLEIWEFLFQVMLSERLLGLLPDHTRQPSLLAP